MRELDLAAGGKSARETRHADAKTRETVLNYLEATYPPRTQRGFQNPFLNR